MRAALLDAPGRPLSVRSVTDPAAPGPGQIRLRVGACGVCRTDLHLLDGEVSVETPPRVLGHQIVGRVVAGDGEPGARMGVPWLAWTCGECRFCLSGRENLCIRARFTGRDVDGGYAQLAVADARYCFALPEDLDDLAAAPLLCAGLIGYRALRLAGDGERLGLYGFGAAAHLIAQVAVWQGGPGFSLTRAGGEAPPGRPRPPGRGGGRGAGGPPPPAPRPADILAPGRAL